MDHPIQAALWLAGALEREHITLEPGDRLSLGGFAPPAPVRPGLSLTVRYLGLPGDPTVSVHFE